jgi:hypothetical protein
MLEGTNDKALGGNLATILNTLATGPSGLQLSQAMHTLSQQAGTTLSLHLIFGNTAYSRLSYSVNAKPLSDRADRANYAAYQKCCGLIFGSTSPANFLQFDKSNMPLTYDVWSDCFIASDDIWQPIEGTSPVANRRHNAGYNSYVLSALQDHFGDNISVSNEPVAELTFNVLESAAEFMNFLRGPQWPRRAAYCRNCRYMERLCGPNCRRSSRTTLTLTLSPLLALRSPVSAARLPIRSAARSRRCRPELP